MADDLDRLPRIPRKAILLRASAELFAARGFRAVSIDEIGHAAGISGPAVYRHFATKADIRDVQADIQRVRSEVETLKVQTRADIEALRLTTKADIEAVKGAIAAAKVETVRWLVGAIGFQTLAVLGAVVALTRTIH